MNILKSVIVCCVLYSAPASAQLPSEASNIAEEKTIRIDPREFEGLPADVTSDLLSRGCTIPQPYGADKEEGTVTASFFSPGSSDLAVLCSIDNVSTILVYRDSSTSEIHELAQAADAGYLQTVDGDGEIGFSRAIGVATSKSIQAYYEFFGGPKPPLITHDGLENIYIGKASTILYWYQDQWIGLQGND